MVRHLIKRGAIAGAVVIGLEAAYAVLRPTPRLPEFDPSASFGDPTLPELRVVVLGDSSVTAPGVSGPEEVWISLVCERLAAEHHVILESLAVGGSCAHDLIRDQAPAAIEFGPDLILVAVGANDVIRGVSRRRFEMNLDHLVADLATTGATIILSGVGDLGTIPRLHPPLRQLFSQRSAWFDRIHRTVAVRHGAHVIEQRADHPGDWYEDRSLWAEDLFHVSAAGHRRWADIVWATVEPRLIGVNGSR
ncbi:MAG: GDSL-type esterase/lipase family protein [Actinomycetota bacterium]|nr:GDSL-type esterase/lipase family protein [Actinomycetota bacterium]